MPVFFETAEAFGAWLAQHASIETALIVGFHKRGSGRPSMTWPESVDEALCFGWIDGVRKNIDAHSYQIRFTPRKPGSTWSTINIGRVEALRAAGRIKPSGLAAYAHRKEAKSKIYAYEQDGRAALEPGDEARFRKNKAAWKFFEAQPPGYRHQLIWRIISAKRAETRQTRLDKLIEASENGLRL